ncbi:hypothetical protein [Telluribacter sp. SYSU D00476]|uniref:hypothetical protein n=1 Tax=Telluribacter sp. SYSU D00476 TaxID=2811430 RepID=UPI001FF4A503|nr:hypothetical protein [Telluribacter sp. SYSU D00476]
MAALASVALIACEKEENAMAPMNGPQKTLANAKNGSDKVTICHVTGNGSSHTLTISINAWAAHEAHGDKMGGCDMTATKQ